MKVVSVVNDCPQFIKAVPVGWALQAARHREVLVHTGQHCDDGMRKSCTSLLTSQAGQEQKTY